MGAARCGACHAAQLDAWRGSHHDLAIQEASEATVLGDFADASFEHFGEVTRFFRRDGGFWVNAAGADGALADFEVAYAFGVFPLQQYLVRFPGGRFQALGVAWDARPREAGGQRWFSLHPDEAVPPGDVLHFTMPAQNWNAQCAECHSTDLRKGYDAAADTYATAWAELNVACEACHGPGARHAAWAEAGAGQGDDLALAVKFAEPGQWVFAPGAAIAHREPPREGAAELETCAPCHARRSTLREGRLPQHPFLDTHRPALLEPGLYEADGQMRDEVYVWGSFAQSRMQAQGVVCSDCHDPHTLRLRAEGNAMCAQCHRPEVFDVPAHHHHEPGSAGAACVACHMPARTYMVVDVRHDHSFRVPRPDLGAALGTPDACTDCHAGKPASWAAAAVSRWFPHGRSGTPHYATALDAGRRGLASGEHALAEVAVDPKQPAIVRATALSLLARYAGPEAAAAPLHALEDPDPLVRLGALEALQGLDAQSRLAAAPLLGDPIRAVRIEAARLLAALPDEVWSAEARLPLAGALTEYRAAQAVNADRPEAHLNLGLLEADLGNPEAARREYETALRLAPWFVPAAVNLADLERALGREAEAEAVLRQALEVVPDAAGPHHALGLLLIRTGRRDEAVAELGRAAELAPEEPRFAYAYALVLMDRGDGERALSVLEAALERHPSDAQLRYAAATLARDLGQRELALRHARALADAWPDAPEAQALLAELEGDP